MLSNSQGFPSTPVSGLTGFSQQSQSGYSSVQSFSNSQPFLADHSLHQGADPNSPAVFQQNIQRAQEHVARLQGLSRSALSGVQNAYHPGNSPVQTEANIAALKQMIQTLVDLLSESGVGALPVLPIPGPGETISAPTEQQLLSEANKSIQTTYEQLERSQDSAAVVANLLGVPDRGSK